MHEAGQGIDAQQERGPERQDDQHQQDIAPLVGRAGDGIGHRIADEQGDDGGDQRNLDRAEIGGHIEAVDEQTQIIVQMQRQLHRAVLIGQKRCIGRPAELLDGQRNAEYHGQRHEEKHCQPDGRHGNDQRFAR